MGNLIIIKQTMNGIGLDSKAKLMRVIDHDWKLMLITAIASILLLTYLATWSQSILAMRSSKPHGKRPPILPYWVPFVGSITSYLWDGPGLAANIM